MTKYEIIQDDDDGSMFRLYFQHSKNKRFLAAIIHEDMLEMDDFKEVRDALERGDNPVLEIKVGYL